MTSDCPDARADCNARFSAQEAWQTRQNGSLQRIEAKVDKLIYAVLTSGAAIVLGLVADAVLRGRL